MLKNDKVNLVIALLIAIGLWTYVMVEVNPAKDSQIKDVPITFLNEETLGGDNLTLLSVTDRNVDVTVKGKVSDLKGIKKEDIKIYADLEGYKEGEHTIRLQIGKIDNVEIECKQKIGIVVDQLITAEKNVSVSFAGNLDDDQEPFIVQTTPHKVQVTGARTLVDSIVRINAPLDVEKVGDDLKAFTVPLYPVDSAGETVSNVTMDMTTASVSAVNLNKKTIPLNVTVIGANEQDMDRTVTVPKTITVKGMDINLSGLTHIVAEPIDVTDIYEDASIPIVPILPEGIEVAANSQKLEVQVTVKGMGSRSFEYSKDAVVAEGIDETLTLTMATIKIQLNVTGKQSVIDQLTAEDFTFAVDVNKLGAGMHQVDLKCSSEADLYRMEYEPKTVTVTLAPGEEPDNSGEEPADNPEQKPGNETNPDADTVPDSNGKEDNTNHDSPEYEDGSVQDEVSSESSTEGNLNGKPAASQE